PPGTRAGSRGLTGLPNHGFVPIGNIANSCRLALPTMRAPAARKPRRHAASVSAGPAASATALHPAVVGTPSTSMMSLTATRGPSPVASSRVIHVLISLLRRRDEDG